MEQTQRSRREEGDEEEESPPVFILDTGPLEEMSKKDLVRLCRNLECIIHRKEEEIERTNKHMEYILNLYYETEAKLAEKRRELLDYKAKDLANSLLAAQAAHGGRPEKQPLSTQNDQSGAVNGDPRDGTEHQAHGDKLSAVNQRQVTDEQRVNDETNGTPTSSATSSYSEDTRSEGSISEDCESDSGSACSGHADDLERDPDIETSQRTNPTRISVVEPQGKIGSQPDTHMDVVDSERPSAKVPPKPTPSLLPSPIEARAKPLHERAGGGGSANFSTEMTRIPVAIERSKSPALSKRSQRRQAKSMSTTLKSGQPILHRQTPDQCACSMPVEAASPASGWAEDLDTVGDQLPPRPKPRPRPMRASLQEPHLRNGRPQTARGPERRITEDINILLRHSISCPQSAADHSQLNIERFHAELSSETVMEIGSPPPARCSTPTERYSSLANDSPIPQSGCTSAGSMSHSPHPPRTPPTPGCGTPLPLVRGSLRSPVSSPSPVIERFSPHPPTVSHSPVSTKTCSSTIRRSSPYPLNNARSPIGYIQSSLVLDQPPSSPPFPEHPPRPLSIPTPPGMHSPVPPLTADHSLRGSTNCPTPGVGSSSSSPQPVTRSPRPVAAAPPSPLMYSPPPVISKLSPSCSTTASGILRESSVVGSMMPDSLEMEDSDRGGCEEDCDADTGTGGGGGGGGCDGIGEIEDNAQPQPADAAAHGEQGIVTNILDSLLVKLGSPESLTPENET